MRRNKVISFRISEQEYELLRHNSGLEGGKSPSDFARLVVSRWIKEKEVPTGQSVVDCISRLDYAMEQLNSELRRVIGLVTFSSELKRQKNSNES